MEVFSYGKAPCVSIVFYNLYILCLLYKVYCGGFAETVTCFILDSCGFTFTLLSVCHLNVHDVTGTQSIFTDANLLLQDHCSPSFPCPLNNHRTCVENQVLPWVGLFLGDLFCSADLFGHGWLIPHCPPSSMSIGSKTQASAL